MEDDWSSLPVESSPVGEMFCAELNKQENRASAQRYTSLTICGQGMLSALVSSPSGSFGVVYEATDTVNNEKVAIKKFLQDHRYRVCRLISIYITLVE